MAGMRETNMRKTGTGDVAEETNGAAAKDSPRTDDAKGTMPGDRGDAKAEPSGYRGENPATAGAGGTRVKSDTAENAEGQLNPASPGDTGTTPGTNMKAG